MTIEGRVSRLEGAVEQFPGRLDAMENALRSEIRASENRMLAEIKAAELRTVVWLGGFIFAAAGLAIAAMKLLP